MGEQLDAAVRAARRAGEIQLAGLRQPLIVQQETAHDVKLQTDLDCEAAIRGMLGAAFPAYAVLGEEGGGEIDPTRPTWIVDPLDGTMNYSRRIPHFCVSIALQVGGQEQVGVIYDPITDELFSAEIGQGAWLNGASIRVNSTAHLSDAIIAVGSGKGQETISRMSSTVSHLILHAKKLRIMGAAALDMAYVAMGRYDGFFECGLRSWDIAAGALLIREAGGHTHLDDLGDYTWDVKVDNGRIW